MWHVVHLPHGAHENINPRLSKSIAMSLFPPQQHDLPARLAGRVRQSRCCKRQQYSAVHHPRLLLGPRPRLGLAEDHPPHRPFLPLQHTPPRDKPRQRYPPSRPLLTR